MRIFNYFTLDFWTVWGLASQGLFLLSFVVQWYKSERRKESYLPKEFWYLRLLGSAMLMVYVIKRKDMVFFITLILQIVFYIRNLMLIGKKFAVPEKSGNPSPGQH